MLRFIWQNWWRHKERFILLLVGALIVSSGLSFLVGLSQANKGTVIDALQKRWTASYDIVVRPPGSRSVTEEKHLLEPDYLSGLSGGISLDQYHEIQNIDGVSVAAPIAMIGYISPVVTFKKIDVKKLKHGLYREHIQITTDLGPRKTTNEYNYYFPIGWSVINKGSEFGVLHFDGTFQTGTFQLLAGIDPEEEAKLVGLDGAILEKGKSRYFKKGDTVENSGNGLRIPIIISNQEFVDKTITYTISRLNVPFDHPQKTMKKVKREGGKKYLDTLKTVGQQKKYSFTSKNAHKLFAESVTGVNPDTGKKVNKQDAVRDTVYLVEKPSPLKFHPVSSPFPKRWPFAYNINIQHDPTAVNPARNVTYRPVKVFGTDFNDWIPLHPYWVGFYDPGDLDIAQDPLTELPMETYRPAVAKLVLDADNEPVNPPVDMKPANKPFGLLTKPPTMLTTIEAASKILGDKPISSIRIKVAGVKDLSDQSQKKLEKISHEIEKKTGLIADITLGSSPQPALTHVPAQGDLPELGWIQQPWVKLGSSFSIFKESKVGFSGVIGSVIFVAIVYVFASELVSLYARRKEFAVLLAIGWRPRQLSRMIFTESLLLGAFVAVVAWTILGWILSLNPEADTSWFRVLLAGLLGFVIYGLGAIVPAILSTHISPYEAMRTGEMSKTSRRLLRTRSIFSMSFNHFIGMWRRSLLSIVAIAVPTGLLAFFLFITFRLKGVMYTTWLGQYVALEVGTAQYIAMAVALLIAVLTTAEIMWQNVSERQPEMALLKSIGWRNRSVRLLVLLEGGFTGFWAGVIGLTLAFCLIWAMYQQVPYEHIGFLMATGVIPIVTGLLGAALPAERAVRILPSQGVRGQYENLKKTEKRFRWSLGIASAVIIVGFLAMIFTTVPQGVNDQQQAVPASSQTINPTTSALEESDDDSGKTSSDQGANKGKQKDSSNEEKDVPGYQHEYLSKIPPGQVYKPLTGFILKAEIVQTPSKVKLKDPGEKMKYISIKLTARNTNDSNRHFYQPHWTYVLTKDGPQQAMNVAFIKEAKWNRFSLLSSGGIVKTINTFKVPKDLKKVQLIYEMKGDKSIIFEGVKPTSKSGD